MKILLFLLCLVSIYGADDCKTGETLIPDCIECGSPDDTECIDCGIGKFVGTNDKSCVTSCGNTFYGDSTAKKCLPCGGNCANCQTTATTCLTCKPTGDFQWLQGSTCLGECGAGKWIHEAGKTCYDTEKQCPEGTVGEKRDNKNYCEPAFGGYLFSGLAIVLALVTLI